MFIFIIKKKSLYIFLAIFITLNLIIYLHDIISTNLDNFLDDNKFQIYIKLPLGIYKL